MGTVSASINRVTLSNSNHPAVDAPVFDPTRLQILLELEEDGDYSTIKSIAGQFVEDVSTQIANIETAIAANDFLQTARIAHTIKGNAATFGLYQLEQIAKLIEASAKNSCRDGDAVTMCKSLREAFAAGSDALNACLAAQ